MAHDFRLESALLIMRWSIAAFLLVWAADKIVDAEHGQKVFSHFYGVTELSPNVIKLAGLGQAAIILAFAAGLARTLTYGAVLLMHATSTVSTWPHLVAPWAEGSQLLFWASVPVLAAMIALFLLRERDRLVSIDSWWSSP